MSDHSLDQRVGAVRRFNRAYTRRIGVLRDDFLKSRTPWPKLASFTSLHTARNRPPQTSPPSLASITAISAASCVGSMSEGSSSKPLPRMTGAKAYCR